VIDEDAVMWNLSFQIKTPVKNQSDIIIIICLLQTTFEPTWEEMGAK